MCLFASKKRSGRPARPNEETGLLPNCGADVDLNDCDTSCDERQSRRVLARLNNRLHMPGEPKKSKKIKLKKIKCTFALF